MNGTVHDVEIGSVGDLELALRRVGDRHGLFRGEDKTRYALRPRAGRFEPAAIAIETGRILLEEFKARAKSLLSVVPADDWEWLALAHHHGLATRLLEWTANPMVAAFWAVQEPYLGGDRVVYVLDRAGLPEGPIAGVSPFDVKDVTCFRALYRGERRASACGWYTLHPDPTLPFRAAGLERWVVRERALRDVCVTVDGFGTEEEACAYTDLDFVCRRLNWEREVGILADTAGAAS
jgi:hypothetical protein